MSTVYVDCFVYICAQLSNLLPEFTAAPNLRIIHLLACHLSAGDVGRSHANTSTLL